MLSALCYKKRIDYKIHFCKKKKNVYSFEVCIEKETVHTVLEYLYIVYGLAPTLEQKNEYLPSFL